MSSTQSQHDLIHFTTTTTATTKTANNDADVLDKPNTGIVQQMVMSETASASLIATAVAKLTTSSVTTQAPSTPVKSTITQNNTATATAINKSESEQSQSQSMDQKFDNASLLSTVEAIDQIVTDQQINKNQLAENALPNEIVSMNTDQNEDITASKSQDRFEYEIDEPEQSLVYIRDLTKPYIEEMHEVPLSTTPIDIETEQEEIEEIDHLSPLIMDNHTVIEHRELFKESLLNNIKEFHPGATQYRTASIIDGHENNNNILMENDEMSGALLERRRSSNEYSSDAISSDEHAKDEHSQHDKDEHHIKTDDENDEPIEIPSDEMAEKIVAQVEFYFSNDNILKDAFLLKHVRRNKEGFVSLKLISSFKRVRQLTKDWRVVGYAIKLKSKNIEVNSLGTKIRRLESLPVFDETMPSRTVVACDLPFDKVTIEKVSEMFSKFGEIALIRILHAGGTIPPDVRQFINKYPDLHQKECAFVEFTESKSARSAMALEHGDMQLYEMVAPKKKTGKKSSVSKLIESYINANTNHADGNGERDRERERGERGERERNRSITNSDFKLRRNSSNFYVKPEHICGSMVQQGQQTQQQSNQQHPSQNSRKYSFNNNDNCDHYNRRLSNSGPAGHENSRKYSNCSEGYSSCSDMSRRTSNCSDLSRRTSSCSEAPMFGRRLSGCGGDFCLCSRRSSQCSDQYRRISQCSEHNVPRRFSNGSMNSYERRISNASDGGGRRVSFDGEYERKISLGSNGCDHYRKISNSYDPMVRKYSSGDAHSRKTSIDSGYERKFSNGSLNEFSSSPRSRSNSFMKNEHLVRTPIGPDGSKGFSTRARKVGQVVVPV